MSHEMIKICVAPGMSVAAGIYWLDDNTLCSTETKVGRQAYCYLCSAPRFTLGGFLLTVACYSNHYLTAMALAEIWAERCDEGGGEGVVKDMERHLTVRHADRHRMQNSEKRIHKVGSMTRKIHGDHIPAFCGMLRRKNG